jgi:hypothetical protein
MGTHLLSTGEAIRTGKELTESFFSAVGGLARAAIEGGRELTKPKPERDSPMAYCRLQSSICESFYPRDITP